MSTPIPFTPTLADEYRDTFSRCRVLPARAAELHRWVELMDKFEQRYRVAGEPLGVPWAFVGVVHSLEGAFDFTTHLHNGDSLNARTVRVPKGRPAKGRAPFSWEASAADALEIKALGTWRNWTLAGFLFQCERWNGFGYRYRREPSDYLWSSSNIDKPGRYIADGTWSDTAVSKQLGVGVLLKELMQEGLYWPDGMRDGVTAPARPQGPVQPTPALPPPPTDEPPEQWVWLTTDTGEAIC